MGTRYNRIRANTKEIKLRIDETMENDLRILYGFDKRGVSGLSFNQWLVYQFHKIIEADQGRINTVKGLVNKNE